MEYLFLAMIAFAAAVASAPPQPRRVSMLVEPEAWVMSDSDRLALSELDFSGNPIRP